MTFEAREYQVEAQVLALSCLERYGGFALFCEQRTGKTSIACSIVQRLPTRRILITGPEIAEQVWDKHIDQFKLITPARPDDEIRYITKDSLWGERRKLKRWLASDPTSLIIVDEGHDFKGKNSKRSRALRILGRVSRYRLLLTGTPQESGLEDYFPQMEFVDPTLFGDWAFFKARYLKMGGFRGKQIIGYKNEEEFARLLHSRSYRVLLEEVKEKKTDIETMPIHFDLRESSKTYQQMEGDLVAEVNRMVNIKKLNPDGSVYFVKRYKRVPAPSAMAQAMKLHQLSGGFMMEGDRDDRRVHWFGSEKLEIAGCLMLELGENVPQVYFCRFVPEILRLGQLFTALGRKVTYIAGKKTRKLLPPQEPYVSGSPFDIVVVQIRSGVSIDLSHAQHAIMYSWDYSHLSQDQAKFRIRSYFSDLARYYYLIARGTIDEQLFDVVVNKHSFAQTILDKYRRK